jgi:hypothetical protein
MRRWLTRVLAAVVVAAPVLVAVPASASTQPYCGIRWGSLAKSASAPGEATLVGVRAGRHTCFDRVVIDISGRGAAAKVRYVSQVHNDPKGDVVALRGGAKLQIVAYAPAYDLNTGAPTFTASNPAELVNVAGYRTLRQVAYAGSFEGQTTIGIGVRARVPFRVFVLAGPGSHSRLVIDVADRW